MALGKLRKLPIYGFTLALFGLLASTGPVAGQVAAQQTAKGSCIDRGLWEAGAALGKSGRATFRVCNAPEPPTLLSLSCTAGSNTLKAYSEIPFKRQPDGAAIPIRVTVDGQAHVFSARPNSEGMYEGLHFELTLYHPLVEALAAGRTAVIEATGKTQAMHLKESRQAIELMRQGCRAQAHQTSEMAGVGDLFIRDRVTGVELSLPRALRGRQTQGSRGLNWRSADGQLDIDTLQFAPERDLAEIRQTLKNKSNRRITRDDYSSSGLHLEGIDRGRAPFIVRIEQRGLEKRGVSVVYTTRGGPKLAQLAQRIAGSMKGFEDGPTDSRRGPQITPRQTGRDVTPRAPGLCHLAAREHGSTGNIIALAPRSAAVKTVAVGQPVELVWALEKPLDPSCRTPLYLAVTTPKRMRFAGKGFLALPGGASGPFDIRHDLDKPRLFVPLHLIGTKTGSFTIKPYETGPLAVSFALVEVPNTVPNPRTKKDFLIGQERVVAAGRVTDLPTVTVGKPQLVVRDNFTLDQPKRRLQSKGGEFELEIYEQFYRVMNAQSGELVLERNGIDPNFSPNGRFIVAYIEGGQSRHQFSDLVSPNAEAVDLYALSRMSAEKPLYLAWGHGDAFFAPAEVPCLRNSCSADIVVYQSLVDGGTPKLFGLQDMTYKSFPPDFQISIDLEAALVHVRGIQGRARSTDEGWASLINPALRSNKMPEGNRARVLAALRSAALVAGEPIFTQVGSAKTDLDWYAQSRRFALSQHCIPKRDGQCAGGTGERYGLARYRVGHVELKGGSQARASTPASGQSRLFASRSAMSSTVARQVASAGKSGRGRQLITRLGKLVPGLSVGHHAQSQLIKYDWEYDYNRIGEHIANIKRDVARVSPSAASLLPGEKEAQDLEQRTSAGCIIEKHEFKGTGRLPTAITHYIREMHTWKAGDQAGWALRTACTNGASGRYWLWLLLAPEGRNPEIIDLSYELRHSIGRHSSQNSGKTKDPYLDWSWDWPQTVDSIDIANGRYLVAHGTWPKGRWATVFDLKARKPLVFIDNLDQADSFWALALSDDAKTLVQINTNGQIVLYDTASGKMILRGLETDDELIVHDAQGYYTATPEGAQFLHVKFPGIVGYNTVQQFASTLNRPDIIRDIVAKKLSPPKPTLAAPPALAISIAVEGTDGRRQAAVSYSASSSTGLAKLAVFVDGRPAAAEALSGTASQGKVTVPLPPEARWISAVATDTSGYESIPRGAALAGAQPDASGHLFVIAVGTDRYDHLESKDQLTGALRDASKFAQFASTPGTSKVYGKVEVAALLDDADLRANLPAKIREIVEAAGPKDTIMLFAAGHGAQGKDSRFYLVTRTSTYKDLETTSLSWSEIAAAFQGVKARVIVFLDACRSGAAGRSSTNDDAVTALLDRSMPITVIAASKGRQDSEEAPSGRGGFFTNAILSALGSNRVATDSNSNGAIELAELYGVIKREVVRLTDGRQTPWIARNQMVGEVPLF